MLGQVSPYIASNFYAVDRYATFKKELEEYFATSHAVL